MGKEKGNGRKSNESCPKPDFGCSATIFPMVYQLVEQLGGFSRPQLDCMRQLLASSEQLSLSLARPTSIVN